MSSSSPSSSWWLRAVHRSERSQLDFGLVPGTFQRFQGFIVDYFLLVHYLKDIASQGPSTTFTPCAFRRAFILSKREQKMAPSRVRVQRLRKQCDRCSRQAKPGELLFSGSNEVARPERFELPTLWFEALEAGNLKSFVCVA